MVQADVVGLAVEIVELAAVAAAVITVIAARRRVRERHWSAPSG